MLILQCCFFVNAPLSSVNGIVKDIPIPKTNGRSDIGRNFKKYKNTVWVHITSLFMKVTQENVPQASPKANQDDKYYRESSFAVEIFVGLLIIIGCLLYFLIRKNSKDSMPFNPFKSAHHNPKELSAIQKEDPVIPAPQLKVPQKMSVQKEREILQKLEEWEKSEAYLDRNMSLSLLSAQLNINAKYISEVINTRKEKNFNGYINELRINHIIHLLHTDPVYLNYKVSYLADYSGFSSHSAFTTIFKSVTGISPHDYIQNISKNRAGE
jgi:AraC-like DNA-binding protein